MKGRNVEHDTIGGGGFDCAALNSLTGGIHLGTLHEQRFFAIRPAGGELRIPFPKGPFTVLVDMSASVDDALLQCYAEKLIGHGCVQAACRGEESYRMVDIFNSIAEGMSERGDLTANGGLFTAMPMDDEPLNEAIEYFVLPCDLAQVGLVMVLGDSEDFQKAIRAFSDAAGSAEEDIGEPVYTEDDLVCFVSN